MLFCVPGDMSAEQCQLAQLLNDLTTAEEYAYGRTDWDVSAVGIATQLLRCGNGIDL